MPPPIIPLGINASISWFENHLADWAANQGVIGITVAQAADITTQTIAARTAFNTSEQARKDARSETINLHNSVDLMRDTGSAIVKTVRAFADAQNNTAIFALAGIPLPSPGNPLPPPATPTNFSGLLNGDGHVELKWSGDIEGRMFFTIMRQVTPVNGLPGVWDLIGSVPDSFLIDTKVPSSAVSVSYRIAARRGPDQSIFTDPVSVLLATPGVAAA